MAIWTTRRIDRRFAAKTGWRPRSRDVRDGQLPFRLPDLQCLGQTRFHGAEQSRDECELVAPF